MAISRRTWVWIFGGIALVIGGIAVGMFLLFRDTATPVTRDEAAAFVAGLEESDVPGAPGIYTYRTVGFEEVDAFGGGHHPYPEETFITIRPEGCGTAIRWQPLEERIETYIICDDGRLDIINSYHVWFGVPDESVWECAADAQRLPNGEETTWTFGCEKPEDSSQVWEYEVLGTEVLEIHGESVEVLHVVGVETITGRTRGGSEVHEWVLPGTLLPVRRTSSSESTTDTPIGPVTYHEEFDITLVSLIPQS